MQKINIINKGLRKRIMITKQQYIEILTTAEKYIKPMETDNIVVSQDYKRGFMTVIAIVKSLTEI